MAPNIAAVVDLEDFLGEWQDSKGSSVLVLRPKNSLEEPPGRRSEPKKVLEVTISLGATKAPIRLSLRPTHELGGFVCGRYFMDFYNSHTKKIVWKADRSSNYPGEDRIWWRLDEGQPDFHLPNAHIERHQEPLHHVGATVPEGPCLRFDDLHKRLHCLLQHHQEISDRLMKPGVHQPLQRFIQETSSGRYDMALWEQLDCNTQKELLLITDFTNGEQAFQVVLRLLDAGCQAESELPDMPYELVDNLYRRITSLCAKQPAIGDKIVELSVHAKRYRFLKEVVRKDRDQCQKLWGELDMLVLQELMTGQVLPEGTESDDFLLRIIDPASHIRLKGAVSSTSATQGAAAAASAPSQNWPSPATGNRWRSSSGGSEQPYCRDGHWARTSSSSSGWWQEHGNSGDGYSGMNHLENVSRKLSLVLRHDTKLRVRPDGFCRLEDLLALRRFQEINCTVADVHQVVDGVHESGNSKQRFQVKEEGGEKLIRANQGYSRKDILAESAYLRLHLEDPDLPEPCIHGTYHWHWASILEKGLLAGGLLGPQGRNEIHFACEEPAALGGTRRAISGMRHDCDLVIWLDLRKAIEEGLPFYRSDNGVILSPGDSNGCIASRYFVKAMDISSKPPRLLWPSPVE